MRITLEPIGIIKKNGWYSEILIYSDFEQIIKNVFSKLSLGSGSDNKLLIVHKNNYQNNGHQVQVSRVHMVERAGNVLKVDKIYDGNDSIIDIQPDTS
ncbi:MAG: hypothetical protein ACLFMM_03090 [Methanohalobium sp.]|uniref:hypothetical protein n=1 Tax=Methanohalobium sp. TaxID=2837493 RepID=UPI00397CA05A